MSIIIKKGIYKIRFILNISKPTYQQIVNKEDVYIIMCNEIKTNKKMIGYLVEDPIGIKSIFEIKKDLKTDLIYKEDYKIIKSMLCLLIDLEKSLLKIRTLNKQINNNIII